jgi:hypothetical protein
MPWQPEFDDGEFLKYLPEIGSDPVFLQPRKSWLKTVCHGKGGLRMKRRGI